MAKRIAWSQHEVALLFRAYEEFAAGAGLNQVAEDLSKTMRTKGRVRKEVLQAIDRIKRSVEDCKSNKQMNVSKDEIIINDIRLLRCVCNYIASQTDRSLQRLYQDFYG